jgi:hypothetical protein
LPTKWNGTDIVRPSKLLSRFLNRLPGLRPVSLCNFIIWRCFSTHICFVKSNNKNMVRYIWREHGYSPLLWWRNHINFYSKRWKNKREGEVGVGRKVGDRWTKTNHFRKEPTSV